MTEPPQHRHSPTDPPLAKRLWEFEPGSRVAIEPGTYVGGMVLPHDVTLVAAKGLGTVTLESSRGPLLSVEGAGRVHLEGLILRGAAIGLGAVLVHGFLASPAELKGLGEKLAEFGVGLCTQLHSDGLGLGERGGGSGRIAGEVLDSALTQATRVAWLCAALLVVGVAIEVIRFTG